MNTLRQFVISTLLLAPLLLTSCKEEGDEGPAFYTIDLEATYPLADHEWMFATDADGNAIDAKLLSANQPITLNGNVGSATTFTLHHLIMTVGSGNHQTFYVRSFTSSPVGGTFHLYAPTGNPSPSYPTASVTINNFAGDANMFPRSTRVSSAKGDVTTAATGSGSMASLSFSLDGSQEFIVSSMYGNTAYYELLEDVIPSSTRTITLRPLDKPLIVNIPGNDRVWVDIAGYNANDDLDAFGYVNTRIDKGSAPALTVGYVNGFSIYRSFIAYTTPKYYKIYEKLGAPLEQMPSFAQPDISLTSESVKALIGSTSIPYHSAMFDFSHSSANHMTEWTIWVKGSESTTSVNFTVSLPDEISSRYPNLKPEFTRLGSAFLVQYKDDYTYEDWILEHSDTKNAPSGSREYFAYRISP